MNTDEMMKITDNRPTKDEAEQIVSVTPEPGYAWRCKACLVLTGTSVGALDHWNRTGHGMPILTSPPPGVPTLPSRSVHSQRQEIPTMIDASDLGSAGADIIRAAQADHEPRDGDGMFAAWKAGEGLPRAAATNVRKAQDGLLDAAITWAAAERVANALADSLNAIEARLAQQCELRDLSLLDENALMVNEVLDMKAGYAAALHAEGDAEEAWKAKARELVRLLEAAQKATKL